MKREERQNETEKDSKTFGRTKVEQGQQTSEERI